MLPAPQHTHEIYSWSQIIREIAAKDLSKFDCRLVVVRHGETVFNADGRISGQTNTSLTKLGTEQSRSLRSKLCDDYDLFCCSTLSRSRQTMTLAYPHIMKRRKNVHFDPRINEISLGCLEGLKRRFIPEYANGNIDFAPKGGETYRELAQRVISFLLDLVQFLIVENKTVNSCIIIFTHTGVIRILRSFFDPIQNTTELFTESFDNTTTLEFNFRDFHLPCFLRSP